MYRTDVGERVDLLVRGDVVVTMGRGDIQHGAVAINGDRIVAVTTQAEALARFDATEAIGGAGTVVMPGLINAHQHLTGDRLLRSTIPDDLAPGLALTDWALPAHAAHTADDDELSAMLSLAEAVTNGITFTVEAGTVAHPERVLAAFDAVGVGGTLGSWGWDVGEGPHVGTMNDVMARQNASLALTAGHPRVHGWVTLVGHDLMTDELVVAASQLAKAHRDRPHVPPLAEPSRREVVPPTHRQAPRRASRPARRARPTRAARPRRSHRRRTSST